MLAAEIDAGVIPHTVAERLLAGGINREEDVRLTAGLQGYGRVLTAAATFLNKDVLVMSESPTSYCPTSAVVIGAARAPLLAERIKEALRDRPNTGKKKFEEGIENRYQVKGGRSRGHSGQRR